MFSPVEAFLMLSYTGMFSPCRGFLDVIVHRDGVCSLLRGCLDVILHRDVICSLL